MKQVNLQSKNLHSVILLLFWQLVILPLGAQDVRVSVYNNLPVKTVSITVNSGKYAIISGEEKINTIKEKEALYISLINNKLIIQNLQSVLGSYDSILIQSEVKDGELRITPISPKASGKTYPDHVLVRIEYGRIMLINQVSIEHYIAGVVESETGTRAAPEFYKAQALLCRTYMYSHLRRHETEGFNLCDEVHCQAYHGITGFTSTIYKSTNSTREMVVVGTDSCFITASFHGNCGGETESSGNTWLNGKDYLIPVKDPYCQQKPNANWTKEIPETDWKSYLKKQGFKLKTADPSTLEMKKAGRQQYYKVGNDSTLTKQIRADWNLKSSFFQVMVKDHRVILQGHGFGHGVGLCQDGAMQMASTGFRCEDIIHYYFNNVRVVPVEDARSSR